MYMRQRYAPKGERKRIVQASQRPTASGRLRKVEDGLLSARMIVGLREVERRRLRIARYTREV